MDFSSELVRGSVVPVVLTLLSDHTMYGYDIVKVVNARTNGLFEWREGTLYPALHRMEAERLIQSQWRAAETGKRRKYYAITRKGRRELAQRTEEWRQFAGAMNLLLMGS